MTKEQLEQIEGWEHLVSGVEGQVEYYEKKLKEERELLDNFKFRLQEARDGHGSW